MDITENDTGSEACNDKEVLLSVTGEMDLFPERTYRDRCEADLKISTTIIFTAVLETGVERDLINVDFLPPD